MIGLIGLNNSIVSEPKKQEDSKKADYFVELLKSSLVSLHLILSKGNVLVEREITRCTSQTPLPFFNAIFGVPQEKEKTVQEQIAFFQEKNASFVWFVEEGEHTQEFGNHLTSQGFKCLGIFQGMVRDLSLTISEPIFPLGYQPEKIQTLELFKQLNEFLCDSMKLVEPNKQHRNKFYENEFLRPKTPLTHWVVRDQGLIVSTLCTLREEQVILFMNGTTRPEYRKKGIFSNLRKHVLQQAVQQGCKYALGYLNEQAMAKNICLNEKSVIYWHYKPYIKQH
jgi:hypothetical protein